MNERALQLDPSIDQARQNLALAQAALAAPRQQAAPAPPAPGVADFIRAAIALSRQGNDDEAIVQYRNAVAVAPGAAEPHVYLALGLLQARRSEDAVAELRKAKAIDAATANDIVTRALHMQPNPDNIDLLLSRISHP